jgi:hypothetical protein
MNQSQPQINKLEMLYWIILGIALGRGSMFYTFVSILGIFLLLTRVRSNAHFGVLLVASVCGGKAIIQGWEILVLHPNQFNFDRILEPIIAAAFAIALLVTQKRALAWCLIVYSALIGVLLLWSALTHNPRESRPQVQFSNAVINGLLTWLLVCWLRKQRPNDSKIGSI